MSLNNEERQILVQRELQKAHEAYEDIEILKARGRWNGAANRLYYSVFHAVNALFINDSIEAGRHKTSHSLFSMHYIKTGILPIDYGHLYNNLQRLREKVITIAFSTYRNRTLLTVSPLLQTLSKQ